MGLRVLCQSLVGILIDSPMLGGQSVIDVVAGFNIEIIICDLSVYRILFIYFS